MEEDEFGGFEAAEPAPVNAQNETSGVQASPNPWAAAMFSPAAAGARNVQPDLLCGQNRFPQHLDNPPTADVAISAEASSVPGADRQVNGAGFDPDLEFNDEDDDQFDLDQVSLANDILDGSFRSSSAAQASSSQAPQVPNISGLDLALDVSNSGVNRNQEASTAQSQAVATNSVNVGAVSALDSQLNFSRGSRESSVSDSSDSRNVMSVSSHRGLDTDQRHSEDREESQEGAIAGQGNVGVVGDTSVTSEGTEKLKKDLEKQILDNKRLSEDLARAHELAEEAKKSYEELKKDHEKQLEDLQQAGHQTLTVVVNEYKALLSTTIAQQQETLETRFVERLKEEAEKFQQVLRQQKEEFDTLQEEERRKNEGKLVKAVEDMRQQQQEKFDRQLAEELEKLEKAGTKELEKQKEILTENIEKKVGEERIESKKELEKQQEQFQEQFLKEVKRNEERLSDLMKEQNLKFQEELTAVVDRERTLGRETMETAVQSTRDGMNDYLEEQRQRDHAQQRRQLASLDLFLESARQQLQLLMSDSRTLEKNEEDKPS